MDDLQFYILFNSVSDISERWLGVEEKLCAVEPCLWLKRFLPQAGLKPGTIKFIVQRLTY